MSQFPVLLQEIQNHKLSVVYLLVSRLGGFIYHTMARIIRISEETWLQNIGSAQKKVYLRVYFPVWIQILLVLITEETNR